MRHFKPGLLQAKARSEAEREPLLHLRFEGRSLDISLSTLRLRNSSSDDAVRLSLSSFLDIALEKLDRMVVERHVNGNITVRPEAVFG